MGYTNPSGSHAPGDAGHTTDHNSIVADLVTLESHVQDGHTGAASAYSLAGATASGSPGSGTFAVGDVVIDRSGTLWVCTAAGTPGTWVQPGVTLDATAADIQAVGTSAAAGAIGKAADAGHVHVGVALDATGSDIQPVGTAAAAGSKGKAADAGHVHVGLAVVATTGLSGFALQNGTPTILSWTVPNDGAMHQFLVVGELIVATNETGGQLTANFNSPDGSARTPTVLAAAQTAGFRPITGLMWTVAPNQTVTITQTALTGGAATLYAVLLGS